MSTEALGEAPYAERASGPRRALPAWAWAVAAVSIFLGAISGVLFAPPGTTVAVWWPAAGISVLFVLLQPPSRIPAALVLVVVVTALANVVGGRAPLLAVAFGIANASEVAVIVAVLGAVSRRFELSTLRAGVRFALAVVLGAVTVGLLVAAANALFGRSGFWETAVFVAASHATATVMIAPFAALPRPVPVRARGIEMLVQSVLLAAVIAMVFHPAGTMPLAFAPFPLLAWAALRFPIRMVMAQTVLAGIVMLLLTIEGGGPFRDRGLDLLSSTALFEAMLVTFGGFAVVLSAAQYELRSLARQVEATNQLLTGSVIDARIGLVVAERTEQATRVSWANRAGRRMLGGELRGSEWAGRLRDAAFEALRSTDQVTVSTDEGRTITVAANPVHGSVDRVAVQLVDVTAMLDARRAQVEAEVEIDAARRARTELERQRDDFLLTTSHELRTPITSIVGYAELLADHPTTDGRGREWVRVIERNARRLSDLVEDLLTVGRGASRAAPLPPERVRCEELFDEVVGNLRLISERKQIDITAAPGEHAVLAARHETIRMLSNLLMNACKFTPVGGSIRVSAEAEHESVRILVADSGPGMAQDEIEQAFERFYRTPSAERDSVEGTGLGLAIVAELARRNDGAVALHRGDGGGLTAELRLPSAAADGKG